MKLIVEKNVYSLEAVEKSAYRFIDRLTILISTDNENIICEIEVVEGAKEGIENLIANFKRELLDQQLRKQIKHETESARNLILAYAFSRTGLQG